MRVYEISDGESSLYNMSPGMLSLEFEDSLKRTIEEASSRDESMTRHFREIFEACMKDAT